MDTRCQCCADVKLNATRMCFSCDPTGAQPVYMCSICSERAHFGPMKLSHHVKSLVNMRLQEELLGNHIDWSERQRECIDLCIEQLNGYNNDLENQMSIDLGVMNSSFEPLKNAVVNRKRELTAEIVAHYDRLRPIMAETVKKCLEHVSAVDKSCSSISQLDTSASDDVFDQKVKAIKSKMVLFDPMSIRDMLPKLEDGHKVTFPNDWDENTIIRQLKNCKLTPTPTVITDRMVTDLTLTPGDITECYSNPMERDGTFWLKLCASSDCTTPLYQLAFKCRENVLLGKVKRYHQHPQDLHTGMVVMLHHPEDGLWYRAIVTDPCVQDRVVQGKSGFPMASVVVADTGYRLDVSHKRLAACIQDDLKMPFLAAACSLYPGDQPSLSNAQRWLFNDLIKPANGKPRLFKAKFVHKKTSHLTVPLWYVELVDAKDPTVSINEIIETNRAASAHTVHGPMVHKDIRVTSGEMKASKIEMCVNSPDGSLKAAETCDRSSKSDTDAAHSSPNNSLDPNAPCYVTSRPLSTSIGQSDKHISDSSELLKERIEKLSQQITTCPPSVPADAVTCESVETSVLAAPSDVCSKSKAGLVSPSEGSDKREAGMVSPSGGSNKKEAGMVSPSGGSDKKEADTSKSTDDGVDKSTEEADTSTSTSLRGSLTSSTPNSDTSCMSGIRSVSALEKDSRIHEVDMPAGSTSGSSPRSERKRKKKVKPKKKQFDGNSSVGSNSQCGDSPAQNSSNCEAARSRNVNIAGIAVQFLNSYLTSPSRQVSLLPPLSGDQVDVSPKYAHTDHQKKDIPATKAKALDGVKMSACPCPDVVPISPTVDPQSQVHMDGGGDKLVPLGSGPKFDTEATLSANNVVFDENAWQEDSSATAESRATSDHDLKPGGDQRDFSHHRYTSWCSICQEHTHQTVRCGKARQAYEAGGCPYCLSSSHNMAASWTNCNPQERIFFSFLPTGGRPNNNKSKKRNSRKNWHHNPRKEYDDRHWKA